MGFTRRLYGLWSTCGEHFLSSFWRILTSFFDLLLRQIDRLLFLCSSSRLHSTSAHPLDLLPILKHETGTTTSPLV